MEREALDIGLKLSLLRSLARKMALEPLVLTLGPAGTGAPATATGIVPADVGEALPCLSWR